MSVAFFFASHFFFLHSNWFQHFPTFSSLYSCLLLHLQVSMTTTGCKSNDISFTFSFTFSVFAVFSSFSFLFFFFFCGWGSNIEHHHIHRDTSNQIFNLINASQIRRKQHSHKRKCIENALITQSSTRTIHNIPDTHRRNNSTVRYTS